MELDKGAGQRRVSLRMLTPSLSSEPLRVPFSIPAPRWQAHLAQTLPGPPPQKAVHPCHGPQGLHLLTQAPGPPPPLDRALLQPGFLTHGCLSRADPWLFHSAPTGHTDGSARPVPCPACALCSSQHMCGSQYTQSSPEPSGAQGFRKPSPHVTLLGNDLGEGTVKTGDSTNDY